MFKPEDLKNLVDNNVFIVNQQERIFKAWATLPIKDNQKQTVPLEHYKNLMPTIVLRRLPLTIVHPGVVLQYGEKPRFEPAHVVGELINVEFGTHPIYNMEGMLGTFHVFKNYPKDTEAWNGVQNHQFTGVSPAGEVATLENGVATWVAPSSFGLAPKPANPGATIEVMSMAKSDSEPLTPGGEKEKGEHPQLSNADANLVDKQHKDMAKCASCGRPMHKAKDYCKQCGADLGSDPDTSGYCDGECEKKHKSGGNSMGKVTMAKADMDVLAKKCMAKSLDSEDIRSIEGIARGFLEGAEKAQALKDFKESGFGDDAEAIAIFNRVAQSMSKSEMPMAKAAPPGTKPEEKETAADEKKETPAQQKEEKEKGEESHVPVAPTEKKEGSETVNKNGNEELPVEKKETAKTDVKTPAQAPAQATPSAEEQAGIQKQVAQANQKLDQVIAMQADAKPAQESEAAGKAAREEVAEKKDTPEEAASKGIMAKIDASPKTVTPRPEGHAHYQPSGENDAKKEIKDILSGAKQFDTFAYAKELAGSAKSANN